ncbi:MAG TPA: plastocyanin/azurin family copper-binding protein [Aliidongia sp.]|nr:plastocyanin/azurin family copper-binding protein [Aliidongia sp.]
MKPRLMFVTLVAAECLALAAVAAEINIDQVNQKFSKSSVTVAVGDALHFKNGDDVTHNINVTLDGGDPEDQGLQKPGEIIRYTFAKAGDYDVRCSIHPRMKMAVSVK